MASLTLLFYRSLSRSLSQASVDTSTSSNPSKPSSATDMSAPSAQVAGAQDSLETAHYVKQSLLDAKIIYCLAPWIMCGIYDIQVILIFKLIPKFTNYMREGVSVTLSITYTAKQSVLFSK